ncbi:32606_t:CDS:2, partial [Racocetra persica]
LESASAFLLRLSISPTLFTAPTYPFLHITTSRTALLSLGPYLRFSKMLRHVTKHEYPPDGGTYYLRQNKMAVKKE